MSGITILALIGLFMLCGALSRRLVHTVDKRGHMLGDTHSADEIKSQIADLAEDYDRLEADMQTRVTELEERLDFAERMIAEQRKRAAITPGDSKEEPSHYAWG